ncbi:hypothetical protein [Desulfonauticus submarinus]
MQELNIEVLPDEAKEMLIEFYEFLLKKYSIKKNEDNNKKNVLKEILSNPIGTLPDGYKFNREEAHER